MKWHLFLLISTLFVASSTFALGPGELAGWAIENGVVCSTPSGDYEYTGLNYKDNDPHDFREADSWLIQNEDHQNEAIESYKKACRLSLNGTEVNLVCEAGEHKMVVDLSSPVSKKMSPTDELIGYVVYGKYARTGSTRIKDEWGTWCWVKAQPN